jgi:hypothetical protein
LWPIFLNRDIPIGDRIKKSLENSMLLKTKTQSCIGL